MGKRLTAALALSTLVVAQQLAPPAMAYTNATYVVPHHRVAESPVAYGFYARPHYYQRQSVFQSHPILSRTLVGAGLGALGGLAVGAIAGRHRAGRGALIGAGVGAGLGALRGAYKNRQYYGSWY